MDEARRGALTTFCYLLCLSKSAIQRLCYQVQESECEALARALWRFATACGEQAAVMEAVIEQEFEAQSYDPASILRGKSVASRLMRVVTEMHGTSFVVSRITSLVQLIVYSDKLSFELDPSKLLEGQTLEANRESLSGAASLVLDHITDSDVPIPASVALLCATIGRMAQRYTPDRVVSMVGSFWLLRLFNPCLTSPTSCGILPSGTVLSAASKRNLLLVSKVLQALSNDVTFGKKEPYMMGLNDWLHENRSRLEAFLLSLVPPAAAESHGSKREHVAPLGKPEKATTIDMELLAERELEAIFELFLKYERPIAVALAQTLDRQPEKPESAVLPDAENLDLLWQLIDRYSRRKHVIHSREGLEHVLAGIPSTSLRKRFYLAEHGFLPSDLWALTLKPDEQMTRCIVLLQCWFRMRRARALRKKQAFLCEQRARVAREMLTSEQVYIHNLELLTECFLQPLLNEGQEVVVPEIASLRNATATIIGIARELVACLQTRVQEWHAHQRIGDIFCNLAEYFKCGYPDFVNEYRQLQDRMRKLKGSEFEARVKEFENEPIIRCTRLHFDDFLIMPVQRVPRLKLLCQNLLEITSEEHPDYAALAQGLERLGVVGDYVNKRQADFESLCKVLQIYNMFSCQLDGVGGIQTFVRSHRRFVRDGKFSIDSKRVTCFLFNDVLVIGSSLSRKGDKYRLLHMLRLRHNDVSTESEGSVLCLCDTASMETVKLTSKQPSAVGEWEQEIVKLKATLTDSIVSSDERYIAVVPRPKRKQRAHCDTIQLHVQALLNRPESMGLTDSEKKIFKLILHQDESAPSANQALSGSDGMTSSEDGSLHSMPEPHAGSSIGSDSIDELDDERTHEEQDGDDDDDDSSGPEGSDDDSEQDTDGSDGSSRRAVPRLLRGLASRIRAAAAMAPAELSRSSATTVAAAAMAAAAAAASAAAAAATATTPAIAPEFANLAVSGPSQFRHVASYVPPPPLRQVCVYPPHRVEGQQLDSAEAALARPRLPTLHQLYSVYPKMRDQLALQVQLDQYAKVFDPRPVALPEEAGGSTVAGWLRLQLSADNWTRSLYWCHLSASKLVVFAEGETIRESNAIVVVPVKDIEAVVPVAVGKASIGFAFRLEIRNQQAVYMAALSDDIRSQWISEIYKLISHNRPEPPQRQLSSYHIPVSDIRIEPSTTVASVNPIEGRKADWLGTTVAVKTLPGIPLIPFISGDIEALQRLQNTPYTVKFIGIILEMPNISFVTEYVSYGCMSRFIATPPSPDGGMLLPPSVPYFVKLQIAADVCRGIAYLHSVNSLHGNLSPYNILICNIDPAATIFAKLEMSSSLQRISKPESLRYRAPENRTSHFETGAPADIFSFGMVLWALFAQRHPWDWDGAAEALKRTVAGNRPSLPERSEGSQWPRRLKSYRLGRVHRLIRRCWSQSINDRPTAVAVLIELNAIIATQQEQQQQAQ